MEWRDRDYLISDDPARVDLDVVHAFLRSSYWAEGIPRDLVGRSIEHSLNFSLWLEPRPEGPGAPPATPRQIGFARVVTDRATFAYLGDVFVLEEFRGRGLARWLMGVVVGHPQLQGLRRWSLLTRDAHRLYEQVGFTRVAKPERYMERHDANVYRRS